MSHWAFWSSRDKFDFSLEIFPYFLKLCADFLKDFQRFSRALPLVSSSLRSLHASFAALSSEEGDLPESTIYWEGFKFDNDGDDDDVFKPARLNIRLLFGFVYLCQTQ